MGEILVFREEILREKMMEPNQDVGIPCLFSFILSVFITSTYIILCFEYPKRDLYNFDPTWMVIAKMWGGLLVFGVSYILLSLLFIWTLNGMLDK